MAPVENQTAVTIALLKSFLFIGKCPAPLFIEDEVMRGTLAIPSLPTGIRTESLARALPREGRSTISTALHNAQIGIRAHF
jgi:hypothetical protein